jgi:hypothetical protein
MQRDEDMYRRERFQGRREREESPRGRSFRPRHGEEGEGIDDFEDEEDRRLWEGRYGTESAYNEGRRSVGGRYGEGRYDEDRYGRYGMEGRYGRDDRYGGEYRRPGVGRSEFREWDEGERGEGRGRRMGRDLSREGYGYGPQMHDEEWQRGRGMSRGDGGRGYGGGGYGGYGASYGEGRMRAGRMGGSDESGWRDPYGYEGRHGVSSYGMYGGSTYGAGGRTSGEGMYGQGTPGGMTGTMGERYGERGEQRRRTGRGLGPKNYTRSDERIREEVCEFLQDSDIDASEIDVKVKGCEVTLEGSVGDRWSKREAEDIANLARGVKDTHNQLRVTAMQETRGNGRPGGEMSQGREPRSGQGVRS